MSDRERLVYGRHAVSEALQAGLVLRLYLAHGIERSARTSFSQLAAAAKVSVEERPRIDFDRALRTTDHQGVMAEVAPLRYSDPEAPFELAAERGERLLLICLDHISDPRNYGAIIRSAEALGAHGVVSETRRSAPLTPVVAKTSAGACHHLPIVQVTNLPRYLSELKARNIWVYGADADGGAGPRAIDWKRDVALVIGSEGEGLRRVVREACDVLVALPLRGRTPALNASVAAAILIHEAMLGRDPERGVRNE